MAWDLRPRLPSVRSMSAIPMAGLQYAVGNMKTGYHTTMGSRSASPPPEYATPFMQASAQAPNEPETLELNGPDPADLERAILFQKLKVDGANRARYIEQGNQMLATSQSSRVSAYSIEDLQFSRQLYIDSIEYLLRGLPSDLTENEKEHLGRSLRQLSHRLGIQSQSGGQQVVEQEQARVQQLFVGLCRGTAIMIKLSIPRIKQGVESAIEFENRFKVLERSGSAISISLYTVADQASRSNFNLIDLSRFSNLAYSVMNGVSVGLCEGYKILAVDN